ncbi:MAG: YbgC/FadM family acyl-CoA thioesterase [Pseudomonadota bacterium]
MTVFSIEQRIYYENTDAGGVMFYGEYLRFFERARTEFMRHHGYNVAEMASAEDKTIFVVRKADIDYLKPIFLDNMIEITAEIIEAKKSSILFQQKIYRDDILCTEAKILCVAVDKNGKVKRQEVF